MRKVGHGRAYEAGAGNGRKKCRRCREELANAEVTGQSVAGLVIGGDVTRPA